MRKHKIIFGLFLILLISSVYARTLTRGVSSYTVTPGGKLTLTYTPSSDADGYFVDEYIPTGWTVEGDTINNNRHRWLKSSGSAPTSWVYTAPLTEGTYVFQGGEYYVYPDSETNIQSLSQFTISVEGISCTVNTDCDDENSCTVDSCSSGSCSYSNVIDGTACGPEKECQNGACVTVGCIEDWQCNDWGVCDESTNQQTRVCVDRNTCGTTNNKPDTIKSCGADFCSVFEGMGLGEWNCIAGIGIVLFGALLAMKMLGRRK